MAQAIPGDMETNWNAGTALPSALVEVQWDGTNWIDETARVAALSITMALYDQSIGLPGLGQAQPGSASLTLDNYDNRYSPDYTSSPIHASIASGIWQIPVRITLGYGADRLRQFTGWVEVPSEWHSDTEKTVSLGCIDNSYTIQQFKYSSIVIADQRADQIIGTLLTAAGITGGERALDRGLSVIPWSYVDQENVWAQCQQIADADGGWCYCDENGVFRFERMSHWLEGAAHTASQVTLTNGAAWWMGDSISWQNIYSDVVVEYMPRISGAYGEVYRASRPLRVEASATLEQECCFSQSAVIATLPVAWTDYSPLTAGMRRVESGISVAMTAYGQRATLTFTNTNTYPVYILDLVIRGVPLVADDAQQEKATSALGIVEDKELSISGNFWLQTKVQAACKAAFLRDRLQRQRRLLSWRGPCAPWLQLGDRVTVQNPDSGVDLEAYVVGKELDYRAGDMFEMTLALLPVAQMYGIDDAESYFILDTSLAKDVGSDKAFY
jgi:hypothetical protein